LIKVMRRNFQKVLVVALVTIFSLASNGVFASGVDKTTEKARMAVNSASPHDWYTLAKSAKQCFKKQVNLTEAYTWLQKSLEIAENSYNLTVLGDYYMMNDLPQKALDSYSKAITMLYEDNNQADLGELQLKIANAKNMTLGKY